MIKYPDHFPDVAPELAHLYSPEALAACSPKQRERRERHVTKMRGVREKYDAKLDRINRMAAAGECYCDEEYCCAKHSQEKWEAYCARVADGARPIGG